MSRVFKAEQREDGKWYTPDGRILYPFICPTCNHEGLAAKSLIMDMGVNSGSASCSECKQWLRLALNGTEDGMTATIYEVEDAISEGDNGSY